METGMLVNVIAEPTPFEKDGYQLFVNAILTNSEGQKLYIPHLLVDTGLSYYCETSETESLYGSFPVPFEARVVHGIFSWEDQEYRQYNTVVEYTGEDFHDVEPFENGDDDTAYFREW